MTHSKKYYAIVGPDFTDLTKLQNVDIQVGTIQNEPTAIRSEEQAEKEQRICPFSSISTDQIGESEDEEDEEEYEEEYEEELDEEDENNDDEDDVNIPDDYQLADTAANEEIPATSNSQRNATESDCLNAQEKSNSYEEDELEIFSAEV